MNGSFTGNLRRLRRQSLIGQLVLLALGVELLLFASFSSFDLPTATQHNMERCINALCKQAIVYLPPRYQDEVYDRFPVLRQNVPSIRYSPYVPLCPAAIFLGYALGIPLGFLATLVYLIFGLVGPYFHFLPFAAGGGLQYYKQPSFGYLLGLVLGAWFAGRINVTNTTSLRQLAAVAGGLFLIHFVGLCYLVGGALGLLVVEGEGAYLNWQPWLFESIRNLSWYPLPYDALFSLALIGCGSPLRWLNKTLTAPDIAMRPRPAFERQLEHVS